MKKFEDYLKIINESKGKRYSIQNNPSSSSLKNSFHNKEKQNLNLLSQVYDSVNDSFERLKDNDNVKNYLNIIIKFFNPNQKDDINFNNFEFHNLFKLIKFSEKIDDFNKKTIDLLIFFNEHPGILDNNQKFNFGELLKNNIAKKDIKDYINMFFKKS